MITLKTIGQFLIGKREAIEKIAGTNSSLLLGFLFIISAGLARNYDHHILTEEPLWIGGPVGMSIFSSLFIYGFVKFFGGLNRTKITSQNYLAFFRCFVMTAPLAWLYGIPVEQFTDALTATKFNFFILVLVSIWRLLLMIRVISVLFGFHWSRAFPLIAIPASFEMFFATLFQSADIVGIMGGMRLSEADRFTASASGAVRIVSFWLFLIFIPALFVTRRGIVHSWQPVATRPRIGKSLWVLALTVISGWLLCSIQPQQRLETRNQLRSLIRFEKYPEASEFLRTKTPSDFPPHQILFGNHHYWNEPPDNMGLLVRHDDWPEWFRAILLADVKKWIEYQTESLGERTKNEDRWTEFHVRLYDDYRDAPFTQKVANELTPGVLVHEIPYARGFPDQYQ